MTLNQEDNTPGAAVLCELGVPHHFVQPRGPGTYWRCARCELRFMKFQEQQSEVEYTGYTYTYVDDNGETKQWPTPEWEGRN